MQYTTRKIGGRESTARERAQDARGRAWSAKAKELADQGMDVDEALTAAATWLVEVFDRLLKKP